MHWFYLFALATKQVRKARQKLVFLPVSKPCANTFDIFRQCTYMCIYLVYSDQIVMLVQLNNTL